VGERKEIQGVGTVRAMRARPQTSFRREVVDLHRAIYRRNQARINASVLGYTPAFRRYERAYARSVSGYERRARPAELHRELGRANVVYIGDYHTLPQAQRAFLRLLRRLDENRRVTLALELVPARHQRELDAFLGGSLDEATFQRLLAPDFGEWTSYREIFELCRRRGYRAVGIDAAARGPTGSTLEARDRFAARLIAKELRHEPDTLVMALVGELHVSGGHLPAQVRLALGRAVGQVIVYQNCERIYWELERRGLEHEVEIVRVREHEYALVNTPPIVCQQSFLNWLDIDEGIPELDTPEENFRAYARIIADFFELPLGDALDEVEIASVVDLSFLERLRRRGDFSAADMRAIKRQILASESYYIPRAKMVYLGRLAINHASEEATHFLRHISAQSEEPRSLVDAFYARVLEEALGFLGSKLINHKRKCAHLRYFERLVKSRSAKSSERALARLVLLHARMEQGEKVRGLSHIYTTDADQFNALTHLLGYRLGDKLYYGLIEGNIAKAEVKSLFFDPLEDEGAALTTYLYLLSRTRGIEVAERF
jgi:hypothetical protein